MKFAEALEVVFKDYTKGMRKEGWFSDYLAVHDNKLRYWHSSVKEWKDDLSLITSDYYWSSWTIVDISCKKDKKDELLKEFNKLQKMIENL